MNIITKDFTTILLVIFLVVASQYYLLHDSLNLGFKPDDWILYFSYKSLGSHPLSQIASVWSERGLYTTYQVYYMGLLDSLFGLNYFLYHHSSLIFKILSIISLYTLILIVFRNKFLAFLSVIILSISHSSVGPLEFVVKGSDYLAIFWMNLFFLVYYLIGFNKWIGLKYNFLLFVLFYLSLAFSPIRMFPLIVIPVLIELFLVFKQLNWKNLKKSLIRILVIYFPLMLFLLSAIPISLHGHAYGLIVFYNNILSGNWSILLTPFSGVGYLFITDVWEKVFGLVTTGTFKTYVYFLLGGPTVICGVITALLTWSRISKYKLIFFVFTTVLNFIIQMSLFFIAFSNKNYNPTDLYSVIFGAYISLVSVMVFIYWLTSKNYNRVLAAFWIGGFFALIFTCLIWLFAPVGTVFNGHSYYLVVASAGASIMTAALLVSIYEKMKSLPIKLFSSIPLLILIPIFSMSSESIQSFFIKLNQEGLGVGGQIMMQQEAKKVLKSLKMGRDAFVYFDTSEITGYGPFYSEGFLTSFPSFMHFQEGKLVEGCIGVIYENSEMTRLRELVQTKNGSIGFSAPAVCLSKGKSSYVERFFSADSFYAFKIRNRKLIDIKQDVLTQLF